MRAPLLLTTLLALAALASSADAKPRGLYATGPATCGDYPRLPIDMARGFCAGLVVGPASGVFGQRRLALPRTLLALDDTGTRWLVSDLGRWSAGQGRVWRLTAQPGKPAVLEPVLSRLSMPHTLARGPDGRVYVGEMSRIIAFDPAAAEPGGTIEVVVSGLPDNRLHDNRHPLSSFIFDGDGVLLVNVGAPSDGCLDAEGAPVGQDRCLESEGEEPAAGIRRYAYLGAGKWDATFSILARGLRNSLALARHPSGAIVQAENSFDFPTPEEPYEEINLIEAGKHYGWPYCFDMDRAVKAWAGRPPIDCASAAHARPAALMAPHAAPLAMLYYHGRMFPQLEGRLVMSWHGYRATGSRLVALDVDAHGVPVAKVGARYPTDVGGRLAWKPYLRGAGAEVTPITTGWRAKPGVRPTGAPVGLAIAPDGAIWVADDRNGTIIRIAADRAGAVGAAPGLGL